MLESLPGFIRVLPSEDLAKGHLKAVPQLGVVLLRRFDQTIIACLDQCPHQPVPLSEFGEVMALGSSQSSVLVCHAHQAVFDLEKGGTCISGPALCGLQMKEVVERDGSIWVKI
jgi:nitrite reductase/ring-hydroxylating ferredoxin subunit